MVDRFLMEQHKNWFSLHPIVREIGLQKLALSPADLQQAHSSVAPYYTRHFEAKQIVGWGALGGHFVEARYHLTKAEKAEDLRDIASRFQSYIFSTLSASSPIPHNAEELDERIAVLSAILESPGPKSLEYHLARLFLARNQRNDLRRGLHHAHRAKSKSDNVQSWLLCSEILSKMGKHEDAIEVLKQGINQIPPNKALVDLYDRCARLLTQSGRCNEATWTLNRGIDRIPPDKALVILYDNLARLLAQMQRYNEAITILKQGIDRIPPDKALAVLYISCCELLVQKERYEESLAILKQGVACVPPSKAAVDVYYRYGELLAQRGQYSDAIAVLKQGIDRIPPNKGVSLIYAFCSELLFEGGQQEDVNALLKEGIDRVPPDKGVVSIYLNFCNTLVL
ncbi:MAG: tetratricopeptide repeat protein [Candidatus Brocadia sp.]|nr:Beta-barrel assembly-enhancing protease [Anaerolineales bacterium]UJS21356.1 MAG: tetratricopeptide repeat protein [Candidatus Brocadia sp.]